MECTATGCFSISISSFKPRRPSPTTCLVFSFPKLYPRVSSSSQTLFLRSSLPNSATSAASQGLIGNSLSSMLHVHADSEFDNKVVADQERFFQVVLVSPQIPGNTGCIARTCAASAVGLHLVGPLGFQVDDSKLKRAGLDYWPYVVVKVHRSWAEFHDYFQKQDGRKRLLAFTKRGTEVHSDFSYRKGDWLVFGSETSGLPSEALLDCKSEMFGGGTIRIPMVETYVRCLNLSFHGPVNNLPVIKPTRCCVPWSWACFSTIGSYSALSCLYSGKHNHHTSLGRTCYKIITTKSDPNTLLMS